MLWFFFLILFSTFFSLHHFFHIFTFKAIFLCIMIYLTAFSTDKCTALVDDPRSNLIRGSYRSCLELAVQNHLESVAFCCISTGEFHFPKERAAEIAVRTVREFLQKETSVKKVIFNVFKDYDREIYEHTLAKK